MGPRRRLLARRAEWFTTDERERLQALDAAAAQRPEEAVHGA